MKLRTDTSNFFFGFIGFLGFIGLRAFALHNPWFFLGFSFFAWFIYFKHAPGVFRYLKYLWVLCLAAPVMTILGFFNIIPV